MIKKNREWAASWRGIPLTALSLLAVSGVASAGSLRAGAAKVDITPLASELAVPGDSIRDPLYVRAIFIDDGTTCGVLVGLDQGAARNEPVQDAVARASAETKCPAENFLISATHTHSGSTGGLGGAGSPSAKKIADAIVAAIAQAKKAVQPARVGYGTTTVDLNVNRDLYDNKQTWRQAPNKLGHSDKTLAVVAFIGNDYVPIGVYMNYAMHPVNFYLSGVISADFPGEASRFVERSFADKTVAIFSQGASGNQNPRIRESTSLVSIRTGRGPVPETIGAPPPPPSKSINPVTDMTAAAKNPVPAKDVASYKAAIAHTGEWVIAQGTLIGVSAIDVMRNFRGTRDDARLWAAQEKFTCPGRIRKDAANPARENVFPGYDDGEDVNLKVGLLRLGDINFVSVNGEVYSEISQRLKDAAPAAKMMMVTLANGTANSGYIYSDDSYSHLTFQVIGSRLKPGCAENRIIDTALQLMQRSGE